MGIKDLTQNAPLDLNPIKNLTEFMRNQQKRKEVGDYGDWRFVGYTLDLNYSNATIITSDPYKRAVGGVPRNSFLIMVPANFEEYPPHFSLLRVLESTPTPLSKEVQQTYFELQKRSMPELDVFTQSELQWGALKTSVLGMFYANPDNEEKIEFAGDVNNFVSPHKYEVFAPDEVLLNVIVNSMVPEKNKFPIGELRLTECRLPLPGKKCPTVEVLVSTNDFMGTRTALFGKTRLGKSNLVKIIAQSLIETTKETKNVGQVIFDINGEYAHDNPQDDSSSLKGGYENECEVYSFRPREGSKEHVLKMNFYENPDRSHRIVSDLLEKEKRSSIYIRGFIGAEVPPIESLNELPRGDKNRAQRRILMYWAILKRGGFSADEDSLRKKLSKIHTGCSSQFDPGYQKEFRNAVYGDENQPQIEKLDTLVNEYVRIAEFIRDKKSDDPLLRSSSGSGKPLFDEQDRALLNFLKPNVGAGPAVLYPFHAYHDQAAKNIFDDIIAFVNAGKTVILDLGNADPHIISYYSDELSREIFKSQMDKFTSNNLGDRYVQLYFEEAHNLFPQDEDVTGIYARLAKEGAKYHIGMVYSTQSPSTINKDLLAQTENFFSAHMSSRDEVRTLARLNVAYEDMQDDILNAKTPGYVRMLTRSNRFVIPVQANKFLPSKSPIKSDSRSV